MKHMLSAGLSFKINVKLSMSFVFHDIQKLNFMSYHKLVKFWICSGHVKNTVIQ